MRIDFKGPDRSACPTLDFCVVLASYSQLKHTLCQVHSFPIGGQLREATALHWRKKTSSTGVRLTDMCFPLVLGEEIVANS